MRTLVAVFFVSILFLGTQECVAADCAGTGNANSVGSLSSQKRVLFVWAKTNNDPSPFPSWASVLPTTLSNYYQVMSYGQHTITTKIANPSSDPEGGFWISSQSVADYKSQYTVQPGTSLGPWGLFVEEILLKIQEEKGAAYFDDVDIIMILGTNGGFGWYYEGNPANNGTGAGTLGVNFLSDNGKLFDRSNGGVYHEFTEGESVTKWGVCHEYGHTLTLGDYPASFGVYTLMQNTYYYDDNAPIPPLSADDLISVGWIDINDPNRVAIISSNTTVTLKPLRSATGLVAAKVILWTGPPPYYANLKEYYLISNLYQPSSFYDGIYPSSGLLFYHWYYVPITDGFSAREDIKLAIPLDPATHGFNFDHLDLNPNDPNFHGEGLATDLFNSSIKDQLTPWTNPNTDAPLRVNSDIAITDIAYGANGDMTFQVRFDFNSGNITADSWWKNSETINAATTLSAGKTLTVTSGSNVTISSGATFTANGNLTLETNGNISVQGGLSLANNGASITGGGAITTSGNGKIYSTSSTQATAFNSSRKLVRDSGGNYHLVYENNGEICYEKRTNSGNALSEFRRLSNGDGNNRFPCITERSGKLYVVWQRQPSSSSFNYDIHYAHSNDGGLSWPTEYVLATTFFTSAINLLPVIQASIPSANKLMVAFRGGSGVAITSRFYANSDLSVSPQSASDWLTKQVSGTTASNAKSPSLIYRTNETGNFQITWDNGTDVLYRKFDGTNWGATTNLSSLLGAAASAHQFASFSVSADDKRHVAWHGLDASLNKKAIFVRELSGTTVTEFYGNGVDYTYPSITGMTASFGFNSAVVLFWYDDNGTNRNVRSSYFNGNCWSDKPYGSIQSTNALHVSSAISNPPSSSTRAVWRRTGNAPYSLALSNVITSGGTQACQDLSSLPKSQSVADSEFVYSRQLLFMLDSTAVLAVRLFAPEITGESLSLDFPQVTESDSLTAATLLDKLRFDFAIPANAEELKLYAEVFALNAGRLLQNGRSSLQPGFEILDQNNRRLALVEAGALTLQGEFKLTKTLTVPIAAQRSKTVRLRPVLSNLDLNRVRGTLVHAYGPQDIGAQTNAGQPAPLAQHETASLVAAHPNPFNPSTQIRFLMPQAGLAALRLFNTNGRLVRELLQEERNAGEHVVTWNGRNENGEQAANFTSGFVAFIVCASMRYPHIPLQHFPQQRQRAL